MSGAGGRFGEPQLHIWTPVKHTTTNAKKKLFQSKHPKTAIRFILVDFKNKKKIWENFFLFFY